MSAITAKGGGLDTLEENRWTICGSLGQVSCVRGILSAQCRVGGEKWRVDASRLEESGWDLKVTGSLLVMPTWSHCASREEIGSVKLRHKSRCLLSLYRIEGAGNMEIDKVMDHFIVSVASQRGGNVEVFQDYGS